MVCIEEYFQYNTEEIKYGYSVTFNLTNKEQEFSGAVLNELKGKEPFSGDDLFNMKEKSGSNLPKESPKSPPSEK
uniref:DUF1433 domain-containing protein n=1 Tax=Strongyloides papillosus TaxID=174720 RepID=A0A0N5CDA6_STREA